MTTTKIGADKTSWTATELLQTEMPEIQWTVNEIMPSGFIWFAGSPKIGKSYFTLQMLIAIASRDGKFLGRKVKHGRVLYISFEDNARRLKKRLRELGAPDILDNFEIEIAWRPLNKGGLEDLEKRLKSRKYVICVLDPYNRAFRIKSSNDTDEITRCLSPLHTMTQSGELTIEFLDHHHKHNQFSGDVIEDISGSVSKGGIADTIWALNRKRGQKDATLDIASRDTDIDQIKLTSENKIWREIGNIKPNTIQSEIIDYMKMSAEDNFIMEIANALGKDKSVISREMSELANKGLVASGNKSGKKIPYYLANGHKKN